MWANPEDDPGGSGAQDEQISNQMLSDLKDQNEQQQVLIAQLKEMLRKRDNKMPQEKVEEYVNTLTKAKSKRNKHKREDSGAGRDVGRTIDSSKKEKVDLLRQQLEENKAKLLERSQNQKGIQEMVTQMKAQLNDSQSLFNNSSLNLSIAEKSVDYSINSSQEELYNILLNKEKRITDLSAKIQKLEENVLDLQENLKEKDSVIDARTKAITLMTESLSKKGKSTLDALEDTKEQMRRMQENFVQLESDMKARQLKLLDDLKAKNIEIADLQDNLTELQVKNQKLEEEINNSNKGDSVQANLSLQTKLEEKEKENIKYLEKIEELEKQRSDSPKNVSSEEVENLKGQIEKLKKQLDESNKNTIKLKAQSKNKIKELNKKIDAFKKSGDLNALVVQLQNDNTKLTEKIAELEEEKGNIQLKLVELENSQKELRKSKTENETLQEKVVEQVSSEMSSIQYEEQIDGIENEKRQLLNQNEEISAELSQLKENVEILEKQKQELQQKLDNYIQENMDLIDKLEKLSAEKVSSAESIEIVEGLTQQEKIEMAAYQKTADTVDAEAKEGTGTPVEFNEIVMQLNEDSSELLKKIEMFNVERREVMSKLEELKEENSQLSLKIKEIENNRDVLAEAYEQLQNEKEKLDELVELRGENKNDSNEAFVLKEKLSQLEIDYESLLKENDELKRSIKKSGENIPEKDENELLEARKKISDLEMNIQEKLEEIRNYQTIIEENKTELINSATLINDLQSKLSKSETELDEVYKLNSDLNNLVSNLESEKSSNFDLLENQIGDMKSALDDQLQQAQEYEQELEQNSKTIESLNQELIAMNKKMLENEHELEVRDDEIRKLTTELDNKLEIINKLQDSIKDKDEKFHQLKEQFEGKYINLEKQVSGNSDNLSKKVEELTNKNKEQMEKMKKIAANLKKKNHEYQELKEKHDNEKEKWEKELQEKQHVIDQDESKITSLLDQLKELEQELELKDTNLQKVQEKINLLEGRIHELETNQVQAQPIAVIEPKIETSLKQELGTGFQDEFNSDVNILQSKVKELEMMVETRESELNHYKERIDKLEETIALLENEKLSFEKISVDANEKLQTISFKYEERMSEENKLEHELNAVKTEYNNLHINYNNAYRAIEDLQKANAELLENNEKLKTKVHAAQEKVNELSPLQITVSELESVNNELRMLISNLEANQKIAQNENVNILEQNRSEFEKIESDFQQQLDELNRQKNELISRSNQLETDLNLANEEIVELRNKDAFNTETIQKLNKEVANLSSQLEESKQQLNDLNKEIANVKDELVKSAAHEVVDNILQEAQEKVMENVQAVQPVDEKMENKQNLAQQEGLPTFQWPSNDQSNQWFDNFAHNENQQSMAVQQTTLMQEPPRFTGFGQDSSNSFEFATVQHQENVENQQNVSSNQPEENTKEELLKKIKTLEFMLYAVEKDKDEALLQCNKMSEELTRLVYERENSKKDVATPSFSNIDSQVVSNEEALNQPQQSMHDLEFTKTHQPEEVIQPKQAYLCYNPTTDSGNLDSQILSDAQISNVSQQELQQIEFTPTHHDEPEGTAVAKDAYLCYKGDQPSSSQFGENDDGWGWGPEEAKLEEEYLQKTENIPQVSSLKSQVDHLNEKINVLLMERDNHLEEIKQLQIKSGKLIKKCKELKLKNDKLSQGAKKSSETGGDFDFGLDEAIQDELKSQIATLEKKMKELNFELEKEKKERGDLLKKTEQLTSSNERMSDLEEKHRAEILNLQRKHDEVLEKLNQHEWADDGFSEKPTKTAPVNQNVDYDKKIEELNKTIKDLSMDNEELQALLEEQRNLRMELEKSTKINAENSITEQYSLLEEEKNKTQEKLNILENQIRDFEHQNSSLRKKLEDLEFESGEKDEKLNQFDILIKQMENNQDSNKEIEKLIKEKEIVNEEYNLLLEEKSQMQMEIQTLQEKVNQFQNSYNALELKYKDLEMAINQKNEIIANLESNLNNQSGYQDYMLQLQSELQIKDDQLKAYENKCLEFENQCKHLTEHSEQLKINVDNLNEQKLSKEQKLHEFEQQLSNLINEREDIQKQLSETQVIGSGKEFLEIELNQLKSEINQQNQTYVSLMDELNQKNIEISNLSQQLEVKNQELEKAAETWQMEVDQRGMDVAESWKLHLDNVQTEFANVQANLQKEINELEERCNALVNENNELRKNVDTEIRNEVDRMSALQQQLNERQQHIAEVSKALHEKQLEAESLLNRLEILENERSQLQNLLKEKDNKLQSVDLIIETTQRQFDEKREVVEEIVKILERNSSMPLSYEKDQIISEFERQLALSQNSNEKDLEFNSLQQQLNIERENKEKDIAEINQRLTNKEQELQKVYEDLNNANISLNEHTNKIADLESKKIELENILQEKGNEVNNLLAKLSNLESAQADNKNVNAVETELLQLKNQYSDLQNQYSNLQGSLNESQQQLYSINQYYSDKCNEVENLNYQLQTLQQLQESVQQLQTENNSLKLQYSNKEQEANASIQSLQQNLNKIQQDYERLLNDKEQNVTTNQDQMINLQDHYQKLLLEKDQAIESLQAQITELQNYTDNYVQPLLALKTDEYTQLNHQLQMKVEECQNLEAKLNEQTTLLSEENKQLSELREIIENQVIKIEDLKAELYAKSNDYDSLIAEMDLTNKTITKQPSASSAEALPKREEDPSEAVSRAELDLALYMLHQRDVRCEELTVELTQLLEERDTLQLRLSNAIREKEEMRRKVNDPDASTSSSPVKGLEGAFAAGSLEEAKDALDAIKDENLSAKLSELRKVGYKKDKTFVDEQELRRLQQISIMQQHINEASKLPPEAAAKLLDASYTLSRDVQSPSKVLLNWLWGRSTPKPNEN